MLTMQFYILFQGTAFPMRSWFEGEWLWALEGFTQLLYAVLLTDPCWKAELLHRHCSGAARLTYRACTPGQQ